MDDYVCCSPSATANTQNKRISAVRSTFCSLLLVYSLVFVRCSVTLSPPLIVIVVELCVEETGFHSLPRIITMSKCPDRNENEPHKHTRVRQRKSIHVERDRFSCVYGR